MCENMQLDWAEADPVFSCTFSDEGYCWSDVGFALCERDLSSSEGADQEVAANGV